MKETTLAQLLDEPRLAELEVYRRRSFLAPQRFVAWTEEKKLLVVFDLSIGEITRCLAGNAETREEAEAAIAELSPKH